MAAAFLLRCLPSVHACLFSFVRKKETVCGSLRFYSAGSRSPFARSRDVGAVICHGRFTSGLEVFLWRSRRGYRGRGERGYGERGYGAGGAALVRFYVSLLALPCFPRGVRWGLRAPKPAPKSLRLSGLSSGAGRAAECALRSGVGFVRIRRVCALLRSCIGLVMLSAGSTLGLNVEAALRPPQTAPKSRMWKRHCRLSGLSSSDLRRGYVLRGEGHSGTTQT